MTWDSDPAYDGDAEGSYVFTAAVDGYTLSSGVELPQITVTVSADTSENPAENPTGKPTGELLPCTLTEGCTLESGHEGDCVKVPPANGPLVKIVTGWTFVDNENLNEGELALPGVSMEQQADFDTMVSMLPTQISADIEGETEPATVDITGWSCGEYKQDGEDNWPITGNYTFSAELPDGYACDPLPMVKVLLGGASLLADTSITWDGSANAKASELGAVEGDTIVITGSPSPGSSSCLTIDKENITVTSAGNPVSDVNIDITSTVHSLTIKDLNLTSANNQVAVYFRSNSSDSVLKVEGTCSIAAKRVDALSWVIRSMNGLTLEVGDASMTVTGSQSTNSAGGNMGVYAVGSLTVNVGSGGTFTARCPVMSNSMRANALTAKSITINNDGTVLVESESFGSKDRGTCIYSDSDIILSGSGITTVKGVYGLYAKNDLKVDGYVSLECIDLGIIFEHGADYRLTGSGELTVRMLQSQERGIGIWCNQNLEMAFTGTLSVHGAKGTEGHGLSVNLHLLVTETPKSLDIQADPGLPWACAFFVNDITNQTNIHIIPKDSSPVVWPDLAPPSVTGILPDSSILSTAGNVAIDFSESMRIDPGIVTFTESNSSESSDAITLTGAIWDKPYYRRLILQYDGLKYNTAYTLNISGFLDVAGNPMTVYPGHTFTTIASGPNWVAAKPVATPAGGAYSTAQTVTLTSTSGADIFYTLDGSDPVTNPNCIRYVAPITVPLGTTLKAFAVPVANFEDIEVMTEVYTKKTDSGGSGGGGGSYSAYYPQSSYTIAGERISLTIPRSDLSQLANDHKSLAISCDKASMAFDPSALNAILGATKSAADDNVTFTAAPADPSAFPGSAAQIGTRPVYDFTISCKDSKGNPVVVPVNFPAGSASISLNYTPAAAEVTGSLFMVYVNGAGAATWLDRSSYNGGKVLAEVPHFSTYGVAYKAPAPVFADIAGHWAKEDIEFAAARGLLSGKADDAEGGGEAPLGDMGDGLFSPDGAMTRGMFVTALGRLAGVDPDSFQSRSFTDVKTDACYAAYVEWAAQKNIVTGTGDKLFSPDAPVTREQMAVMMVNYAVQMGYSISAPLAAVTFADNADISVWAAKEVAAMQRAGIVRGKDGSRFDPQGNATRAEGSAVLRRFVEAVIDPATASGWVKNDSGQWLCYKGGAALTGWQEIDGKWYYFDKYGVMAVNTRIDGYEVGPDGARKDN